MSCHQPIPQGTLSSFKPLQHQVSLSSLSSICCSQVFSGYPLRLIARPPTSQNGQSDRASNFCSERSILFRPVFVADQYDMKNPETYPWFRLYKEQKECDLHWTRGRIAEKTLRIDALRDLISSFSEGQEASVGGLRKDN